MDFGWTEEQEMLRRTARDFLAKECPKSLVRAMEKDEAGFSPELMRKMAELGWTGLIFPEEYEGGGGEFLDLVILIEEMGRALLPGPFLSTVLLGGLTLLHAGSEEQKRAFLPGIAQGEKVLSLALTEPSARFDAAGVQLRAVRDREEYCLSGTKLFVPDARAADGLLCVARTAERGDPTDGLTLLLVDGKSPGLSCIPLRALSADRPCEVDFQDVRVPVQNVVGEVDRGWEVVSWTLERAALAECAWMVGGAQQVIDMTVNYSKERVQFDRPIGSFQAIQHKCANMLTEIDGARYITYLAAWKVNAGLPASQEISMAKAWVSEAYRRACLEAHQIHGGIGFTEEHDLGLYLRRARRAELSCGDASYHRERLAQLLGL